MVKSNEEIWEKKAREGETSWTLWLAVFLSMNVKENVSVSVGQLKKNPAQTQKKNEIENNNSFTVIT